VKKVIFSLAVVIGFSGVASADMKYECNRYVGGDYQGYTTVVASNKAEAEKKAYDKFKNELGKKVDYVKCN